MNGTFQPGDCLWMKPVPISDIRLGDVVIYLQENRQKTIKGCNQTHENPINSEMHTMDESQQVDEAVHRVIAIRAGGLVTRGDNNDLVDPELVTGKNLVGLVTHVERGGKMHQVQGSWRGLVRSWLLRAWKFYLRKIISRFGHRPYQWIFRWNWVPKIWHPAITKIRFSGKDEQVYNFIAHGQIVARWWPARNHFECQKPYDLILRREHLPRERAQ